MCFTNPVYFKTLVLCLPLSLSGTFCDSIQPLAKLDNEGDIVYLSHCGSKVTAYE